MRTIKAQALTTQNFRKYGSFQNLLDNQSLAENGIMTSGFFPDLISLDFGMGCLPGVCVCNPVKEEKNVISFMEAHRYSCEGLLPLDDDVLIYVGAPGWDHNFTVEQLEAFLVPQGTFVKLNPYIIHGTQYPVHKKEAHLLCLLPGRTFKNDMLEFEIEEESKRAEIIM